ncbi:MAG: hypothetical protein IKD53_12140 [Clostridia bacterium]|nr:hypothetical protein [Clostridia bacterium]
MNTAIKPIETIYNGYRFRSRLEARWAVFFDATGIKYQYEPEGFKLSDGIYYLPDFYLPDSDTFVEIKGVMSEKDTHKIDQFMKEMEVDFLIGYSDFQFQASDAWYSGFSLAKREESVLCRCHDCGKYYFMGWNGKWACKCCGAYDGDGHFDAILDGDGDINLSQLFYKRPYDPSDHKGPEIGHYPKAAKILQAITKARQARFEHGERP